MCLVPTVMALQDIDRAEDNLEESAAPFKGALDLGAGTTRAHNLSLRAKRHERNLWISLFSLAMSCIFWRSGALMGRLLDEKRDEDDRKKDPPGEK